MCSDFFWGIRRNRNWVSINFQDQENKIDVWNDQ